MTMLDQVLGNKSILILWLKKFDGCNAKLKYQILNWKI